MSNIEFIDKSIKINVSSNNGEPVYKYDETKTLISKAHLLRIKKLKIPVVYTPVYLSKNTNSDIQAVAIDCGNKKQYYYSDNFIRLRNNEKENTYEKIKKVIPKLNYHLDRDIKKITPSNLEKKIVMSLMLKVVVLTAVRIGNKKYLDKYNSFGLTTIMKKHVQLSTPDKIVVSFSGKHKITQNLTINNKLVCDKLNLVFKSEPEIDWLFFYVSENGKFRVSAQDLNEHLQSIIGKEFSVKDIRMYVANECFVKEIKKLPVPDNEKQMKKNIHNALVKTSETLGNNLATAKSSYVLVINEYMKNPSKYH